MPDDIRKFNTPEGEITVNRSEVTYLHECPDFTEATLIEYSGRTRLVMVRMAEVIAWVKGGGRN